MTRLKVDVIHKTSELAMLERPWEELVRAQALLGPFCDYGWQFEWWRALGHGRNLNTFVARQRDDIRAILPMYMEQENGARGLFLIASQGGGADYLTAPATDLAAQEAVVDAALSCGADFTEFDDILWSGTFRRILIERALLLGLQPLESSRYPCPYIPLKSGFEPILRRSGKREILRRRRRWLESQPGFKITCESTTDAIAPFLQRFLRLHEARWEQHGGSEAFSDERLMTFHEQMTRRQADRGTLRLWTLYLSDSPVAVLWAFDDRQRAVFYQSGFLPSLSNRSVGFVLFARFIEDACERGLLEVDLLRGNESYKFEWTREARLTRRITVPLTPKGKQALALRALKNTARSHISAALPGFARHGISKAVREARMRGATSPLHAFRRTSWS